MNLFKKTSRKWRGVDFMALVPARSCGWAEGAEPGQIVVLQPRFRSGLLGRFVQPRLKDAKKFVRIPLESRGSFLWKLMDGKRTVGDLAMAFATEFPEDGDQIPERVSTYLYQMSQNHFIEFLNSDLKAT